MQKIQKAQRISKLDFFFSKKVGEAIAEYKMIDDGDRVLIGISGGISSLSLLKALRYKQGRLPIKYEILPCYVDISNDKEQKKAIERFFREKGYDPYIVEGYSKDTEDLTKILKSIAKKHECQRIALGHNQDDIAEGLLYNMFFLGKAASIEPKEQDSKSAQCIIRPLYLCQEKFIRSYVKESNLEQLREGSKNNSQSKRGLIKKMLHDAYDFNKTIKINISRSLNNINCDYLPTAAYVEE